MNKRDEMNTLALPILVGERVFWLASGSGIPQASTVRWIGHLPEIGPEWTVGLELDDPLPYGGIDGAWGNRLLFTCKPKHGLLVPQSQIAPASNYISSHIPEHGHNSKFKTSCRDLTHSSLNSFDNEKNTQIISYKPNITTSPSTELIDNDFERPRELSIIGDVANVHNASHTTRMSPTAPPRSKLELKLKNTKCPRNGGGEVYTGHGNDIAVLEVKHNNDGSRIVDVCNPNNRLLQRNEVDSNGDNVNRMSGVFSQNVQATSQVESISVSDGVHFAARRQIFFMKGRSHSDSSQDVIRSSVSASARKEKTASGLFSFLRWFRRIKSEGDTDDDDDDDDDDEQDDNDYCDRDNDGDCAQAIEVFPPSPRLIRSNSSSCGSVDTLFSTATASSFAFIHPYNYRPFGSALQSPPKISEDSDTETYRQRIKQSERIRKIEKNISLRKKYNLFGSGTICRSLDSVAGRFSKIENVNNNLSDHHIATISQSSTLSRKKRKAPPPPQIKTLVQADYSLPSTLNHLSKQNNINGNDKLKVNSFDEPFHRRTVSESARDRKAGAYCHVRGKRKAPPPPVTTNPSCNEKSNKCGNHSLGRKKRPAPQPPTPLVKHQAVSNNQSTTASTSQPDVSCTSVEHRNQGGVRYRANNLAGKEKKQGSLSLEEKERLLKNIAKLQAVAEKRNSLCFTPPSSPSLGQKMSYSLCNDTLKLEKGILKPNRSLDGASPSSTASSSSSSNLQVDATKVTPSSPVSPRPWYKRNITKDSHSSAGGKTPFDKRKERTKMDDWMPEVAIARSSLVSNDSSNKFNLFSSKSDKVEEKRKSQISMLVNISELDREAAEIVQKEHAKEKAILDAEDAKFYSFPELQTNSPCKVFNNDQPPQNVDSPKRSSAKVSLFNAITKVTVNTTFFSRETSSLFSRDGREKRFSFGSSATSVECKDGAKASQSNCADLPQKTELKQETVIFEARETYLESPGEKRRRWNRANAVLAEDVDLEEAGRVTIEEIKEFDDEHQQENENLEQTSKTLALYEANRLKRHHSPSPSIPTIAELSETTSSIATSPGSTLNQSLGSPTTPTTPKSFPSPSADDKPLTKSSSISYWVCSQCTLENPSWRFTCEVCDTWKPSSNVKTKQVNLLPLHRLSKPNKDGNLNNDSLLKNIDDEIRLRRTLNDSKESNITPEDSSTAKSVVSPSVSSNSTENTVDTGENADIEEVRKARLAFFNKTDLNDDKTTEQNPSNASNVLSIIKESGIKPIHQSNTNADEKLKLREMLKDLKHSLPKRSKQPPPKESVLEKPHTSTNMNENNKSPDKPMALDNEVHDTSVKNLGAIKKTSQLQKSDKRKNDSGKGIDQGNMEKDDERAEIYLMKTETIIEEIKVKKQTEPKPGKVSTSAQTSAMIRKCDLQSPNVSENIVKKPVSGNKQQNSKTDNYIIPITEEDYTIKDGVLHKSLSENKMTIGKKTFELILARDFADIKATKTGKVFSPAHVYANDPAALEEVAGRSGFVLPSTSKLLNERDDQTSEAEVDKLTEKLTCAKGIADFKADLEAAPVETEDKKMLDNGQGRKPSYLVNTVAVNRRLRRLEAAIAKGDHQLAAQLARELAQLKINCSVTRHKVFDNLVVDMYVEDKVSHQGPIALTISPSMSVAELKMKVERELEIPSAFQRWILGKQLAIDDAITLADLGVSSPHYPIFLYLVAPEASPAPIASNTTVEASAAATPPQPPPPPEQIKRGGWYYNDEEDKLSFCADSESDQSGSIPGSPEPVELISDYSEQELSDHDSRPPTPPQRDLEPPSPRTGTLKVGWKCEVCTLMNSPLRPGCAACTSPRPLGYEIPPGYEANEQELMRIQNEEKLIQDTAEERLKNYQELVNLENADIVASAEPFDCPICLLLCLPGDGVVLRDCLHTFCRPCLIDTVQYSEEAEVKCPYRDVNYACDSALLQREIKALVPGDVYEQHLAKSVTQAENKIGNTFHCKTPDCRGWCIFEDNVNEFPCPVCNFVNCLTCQAIHTGINCKQYQERAKQDSDTNADARRTNAMLEEMVERGEAMKCPTCQVILMKKWGCDWLRCSMCKTEICWVTRGPRWGPMGKGDTSGGCQCGVNGVKCHPKCNYCH